MGDALKFTMKDTEYWEQVIRNITPYEFSSLISVLTQSHLFDLNEVAETMDMESVAERLDQHNLIELIEYLAMRADIVDLLKSCNRMEWCNEGKAEMRTILQKAKQLKLQLKEAAND
jgi:replicative DNA helicase